MKPKATLLLAGLLAGAALISASAFTVDEAQQAFVVQFGKVQGEAITQPGLHWKLPFIQEVRRFDKRLLIWNGDVEQIPTLGREFVLVDTTARWRIANPRLFLESMRDEQGAQSRMDDILDSVVRDKISSARLEEIVRSSDWQVDPRKVEEETAESAHVDLDLKPGKGRGQLERDILELASAQMPSYGIELLDVRIKRVNYIKSVREQVENRMISERQSIAERFRSEGRGRSEEILGEMQKELQTIRSEARRNAETIRGRADGEVTRIYGRTYGQDPEFYSFLKTLEAYRVTVGDNTTLMIRGDSDLYRYLGSVQPAR